MSKYKNVIWSDIFDYDESSPSCLTWKVSLSKKIEKGRHAGSLDKYWMVIYQGVKYRCHRIIWEMFHGLTDGMLIDHIDRDKLNNRIQNLREVTVTENARNQPKQSNNKTGKTGVWRGKGVVVVKYDKYVAGWYDLNGKRKTKAFSVRKLGEEESFRLATKYRDERLSDLNTSGAGYTETHGE